MLRSLVGSEMCIRDRFYFALTPTLACELHNNIKADGTTDIQNSVRAGAIFMLMPLYVMFVIAYFPTKIPSFSMKDGVFSLVLRIVQIVGALLLIIGQFIQWSTTDLCANMNNYGFLTPDGFILTGLVVILTVIGGSDNEGYDIGIVFVSRFIVDLVPFNPFAPTSNDETKKMLASLWMAYIGSVMIVAAAMLASKFVAQAWTNPSANGGKVGTDTESGASLGERILVKVRSPIMITLIVMMALAFVGCIMVWVRLPTPDKDITPTLAMKQMNYYAGVVMAMLALEMVAFLFDIWGLHLVIFFISLTLNSAIINAYMSNLAPSGTGEGVLRGGMYLLSWISLIFPFVVPVLRRSSVVQEGASKPIDQMVSFSDPAARRGAIIAILALIFWYYGGVEFQYSRYDETLMIAATMVVAHIFEDADMQRIVYFFMATRVSIFMPFSSSATSLASMGIFVFVVALIFFGLYVSTFPSPQTAADGADASVGVAAFNGIVTFVVDGAASEVSYESVDNYAGAPIEKEASSSPNNNTAEASKPLLGDSKEPADGVDSPRSEGYGSA
eukprot:TRINITY_DN5445_c0_g1_i3.p1 TRINITY_DN5445_c0_g1~~TRINITY_DN5445_c0_g1_i3.p1  ORF type:complete len:594 (+),score=198.42 TRINITY_DN5445_c0_g1_i3:109-1782(+)